MHEGGCLFGSVRYRTRSEPRRGLVCRCTLCQPSDRRPFLREAAFLREDVEITGGPIGTCEDRPGETGRALRPRFCNRCGTILGRTAEWSSEVRTRLGGTFDRPHRFEIDEPTFARSAARWMTFPPDAEVHKRHFLC